MTHLLAWFNPTRWILMATLVATVAIGVPVLIHRHDSAKQAIGYDKRKDEDKAAADAQTARNLDLQRLAEKKYVVQRDTQDHYFVTTVKEIRDAAAPLAACVLPDVVRLRLNAARDCTVADSGPTCGADGQVPSP